MGTRRVLPTGRISFYLDGCSQHLRLQIDREFSHFVEEHSSRLGQSQESIFGLVGSGEGAFDVAKEFTLNQGRNERSAVHGKERLVAEGTGIVDGACDHLFAGTALAQDQHRVDAVGGLGDDAIELLHFRSTADDAAESLFGFHFLA